MEIIAVLVIVAALLLLLILRGAGEATEVAEQQEAELLRELHDAEAIKRITQ